MTVRASRSMSGRPLRVPNAEFEAHKHPAMACGETQGDGIVSPRDGRTWMLDFRLKNIKKARKEKGYEYRIMKWLQWEL